MSQNDYSNSMTVGDLMSRLEGLDPEAPVMVAYQPHYPLQFAISEIEAVEVGLPDEGDRIVWTDPNTDQEREGCFVEAYGPHEWVVETVDADDRETRHGVDPDTVKIPTDRPRTVVYISEGYSGNGYLPGDASRALGWR
jgi:hypothetical protein